MNAVDIFADLPDDLEAAAKLPEPPVARHPFEAAGLGVAPFQCVGCIDQGRSIGHCNYCGTGIRYEFEIVSSDGKRSVVGSDCIALARGDVIGFKHFDRVMREKKSSAAKVKKASRLVALAAEWKAENPAVAKWLDEKRSKVPFALSLSDALAKYGRLTPGQIAAVERSIERDKTYEADRAHRAQVAELAAPVVDCTKLHAAFARASEKLKYPKITLGDIVVSPAGKSSANAGALYVKRGRGYDSPYLGKVMGGKFLKSRDCTTEEAERIAALVNDPMRTAEAYGLQTGNCCMCNRELTDPVSVARGIGPICAENYGW